MLAQYLASNSGELDTGPVNCTGSWVSLFLGHRNSFSGEQSCCIAIWKGGGFSLAQRVPVAWVRLSGCCWTFIHATYQLYLSHVGRGYFSDVLYAWCLVSWS